MKNLGKYFLIIISSVIVLQAGSVRAFVSDSIIEPGESVVLHIKAQGDDIEFPDIKKIGDYKVESVSSGTSYSMSSINGQSSSTKEESRSLVFSPESNMTIPSFEIKVDDEMLKTDPIEITVANTSNTSGINTSIASDDTALATLTLLPSKSKLYEGESVIVTLYFRYRRDADIARSEYEQPSFDGFLKKEIGDVKEYRDGAYNVKELNYALTPLKNGKIEVGAAKVKFALYVQRNSNDMLDMFFKRAITKTAVSKPFTIDVQPLPKSFDLVGNFQIDATIDKHDTEPNKPVELTLFLEGYGMIDGLDLSKFDGIENVTVYKDEPIKKESIKDGKLYTSYTQKIAFVSDRDFTIPSLELTLFDPQKEIEQSLKTEPISIKVKGGAQDTQKALPKVDSSKKEITLHPKESVSYRLSFVIFVVGVIVGMVALLFYKFIHDKRDKTMSNDALLAKLYPYISKDKEIEAFVRELYAKKAGDKSITIDKKRVKKILESLKNIDDK